jgi:hypothetical protein
MTTFVIVAALGIAGIFVAAWLWPLPQGQGFAFVAHPFFALIGCGVAALGAAVASIFYADQWVWCLIGGVGVTWTISSLIFLTA